MARLQILYLPATEIDPNPFAIIIDQVEPEDSLTADMLSPDGLGARAVLVFPFTVDIV